MRRHALPIAVMLVLVAALIAGINMLRYQEFVAREEAIAQESTRGLTIEVMHFLRDRKRLVAAFTDDNQGLIARLIDMPDDVYLHEELARRVERYFPDYSTFAVTDRQGELVVHDFNFLVGDLCLDDIRRFNETGVQRPRVHPSMNEHHFDILGEFSHEGKDYIFLMSFDSNILGSMLNNLQSPRHQLLLLYGSDRLLVEATAAGSRQDFYREDYHLNPDELSRILDQQNIPGSAWIAADLSTPDLMRTTAVELVIEGVAIFVVFLMLSGVMLVFLNRAEASRLKAEGMKDEFLSVVSHELRTPITSMMGSLGLLANGVVGQLPDRAQQLASMALSNCERLLVIVNDILDIQRIESGKLEVALQPADLNAVVRDAVRHNESYAAQFGSHFTLHESPKPVPVRLDPTRFSQVLDNLLSNAVKYGREKDEVFVQVLIDHDRARVVVTDHGPGISPEFQQHIFQKFSQGDSSHRRRRDGTGLGLSIAKYLVEEHGGRIGFETEPDRGTSFFVDLPLRRQAA